MKNLFNLIIPLIFIISILSVSVVSAQECNVFCQIMNFITGGATCPECVTGNVVGIQSETCPDGMVSYWRGNGDAGDVKGINNGAAVGGLTYTTGKVGQAFNLDGNSYIDITTNSFPYGNSPRSVEAWVNIADCSKYMNPLSYGTLDYRKLYQFTMSCQDSNIQYQAYNFVYAVNTPFSANTWYHIVNTFDGTTMKFYVNNQLLGQSTTSTYDPFQSGSPLSLMNTVAGPNHFIGHATWPSTSKGLIDEVAVYNRALTDAEVADHYNGGTGKDYCAAAPEPVCPSGMISYYKAEGDASDTVGTNDGALMNGATATATGILGQGFSFDGINDYVELPTSVNTKSNEMSVELWLNRKADITNNHYLIFGGWYGAGADFNLEIPSTGYPFTYDHISVAWWCDTNNGWCGIETDNTASSLLTKNQWVHVTVTRDSTGLQSHTKMYINGAQTPTHLVSNPGGDHAPAFNSATPFRIGGSSGGAYFNANIDEVAVYGRELTAAEVVDHYNSGAGKDYCAATPSESVCGNAQCETGENSDNCCQDCGCPSGQTCSSSGSEMQFISTLGTLGSGQVQFNAVREVEFDSLGNMYVADYLNHRIQKLDSNGNFISAWTGFQNPQGLAVDAANNYVYIADTNNQVIKKYNLDGTLLATWSNGFLWPRNTAVDSAGNIYVTDAGHNRIMKLSSSGATLAIWVGFNNPHGIALDSSGNIYVADEGTYTIKKLDSSGNIIATFGSSGSGDGQLISPQGLEIDSSGNIWIADSGNHRIQKLDSSGNFVAKWGTQGSADGQFYYPTEISFDPSGNIWIADPGNNRLEEFSSGTATCQSSGPTCSDGIKNQDETDVDCGGAICDGCNVGQICVASSDCLTNLCSVDNLCIVGGPAMPACDTNDVNGDGDVNVLDAIIINRMAAMLPWHITNPAGCEHIYIESD